MSTALHFAVFLGNVRLTKTLLDVGASLTIPCSPLLWRSMGSEQLSLRFRYFLQVLGERSSGPAFPIFLAFLQSDPGMCKILMEHRAGREAMIFDHETNPKVMSILHFAAADRTTDYRQWQCLFDGRGCTQGMRIAVESGADKEARDGFSRTPLSVGVSGFLSDTHANPEMFEERTMCFRKFMELGASINPEGDSVLVAAVQGYAPYPVNRTLMRRLISFLLEHHADIHGTSDRQNTNVVNEIIKGILDYDHDPPTQELLKELLSDLVDRGLNLTIPAPGLSSPLYRVLRHGIAKPEWLFDLLCEKGATIHEVEVNTAFLS
ncbi:uncharacterized protein CPUR_03468 [Claviceps purpurea 20.1]|uniref:Uncharacterized protein n=1 Tax=Claviceps purpurea (strain 20.1) TaxID=1111077 RepID=M1W0K7_CLAP2|nr:uncharacterized protein CPUR_03468 [Claviceps purpurea 20.1]